MNRTQFVSVAVLLATTAIGQDEGPDGSPGLSVYDRMVTVIAPATDTLWGIEDPQSDADWQVFVDAANVVIDSGNALLAGGTGRYDAVWAADPQWRIFVDQLVAAGRDARRAAENRDLDAMWTAGEVLYPPCEECHLKFNPGVLSEQ